MTKKEEHEDQARMDSSNSSESRATATTVEDSATPRDITAHDEGGGVISLDLDISKDLTLSMVIYPDDRIGWAAIIGNSVYGRTPSPVDGLAPVLRAFSLSLLSEDPPS